MAELVSWRSWSHGGAGLMVALQWRGSMVVGPLHLPAYPQCEADTDDHYRLAHHSHALPVRHLRLPLPAGEERDRIHLFALRAPSMPPRVKRGGRPRRVFMH